MNSLCLQIKKKTHGGRGGDHERLWLRGKAARGQGHASSRSRAGLGSRESGSRSGEEVLLSSAWEQLKPRDSLLGCWSSSLKLINPTLALPSSAWRNFWITVGNWQDVSVLASFLLSMYLQAPLGGGSSGMNLALNSVFVKSACHLV